MSLRSIAIALLVCIAIVWWVVRDDPETQVRDAHLALASALNKPDGDAGSLSILELRALQQLFADDCVISGDADTLARAYNREEIAGMIVRMRGLFRSIDLTISELTISFPSDDAAVTEFSAVLNASSDTVGGGAVAETRRVTTRMRNIHGVW
ncbi:MAG TPA: hypothetical protein VKQ06_06510, partial [Gammaproteobacteria bacterium]|nr:hypothetical protein [Gammaproteobacteria bacterium]